ncbi:hypothetical protein BD413DRAFT_613210 [Trametes elegans]|nr:hypothetical protein BD413DRAFT_613210 [Trametes elegans]
MAKLFCSFAISTGKVVNLCGSKGGYDLWILLLIILVALLALVTAIVSALKSLSRQGGLIIVFKVLVFLCVSCAVAFYAPLDFLVDVALYADLLELAVPVLVCHPSFAAWLTWLTWHSVLARAIRSFSSAGWTRLFAHVKTMVKLHKLRAILSSLLAPKETALKVLLAQAEETIKTHAQTIADMGHAMDTVQLLVVEKDGQIKAWITENASLKQKLRTSRQCDTEKDRLIETAEKAILKVQTADAQRCAQLAEKKALVKELEAENKKLEAKAQRAADSHHDEKDKLIRDKAAYKAKVKQLEADIACKDKEIANKDSIITARDEDADRLRREYGLAARDLQKDANCIATLEKHNAELLCSIDQQNKVHMDALEKQIAEHAAALEKQHTQFLKQLQEKEEEYLAKLERKDAGHAEQLMQKDATHAAQLVHSQVLTEQLKQKDVQLKEKEIEYTSQLVHMVQMNVEHTEQLKQKDEKIAELRTKRRDSVVRLTTEASEREAKFVQQLTRRDQKIARLEAQLGGDSLQQQDNAHLEAAVEQLTRDFEMRLGQVADLQDRIQRTTPRRGKRTATGEQSSSGEFSTSKVLSPASSKLQETPSSPPRRLVANTPAASEVPVTVSSASSVIVHAEPECESTSPLPSSHSKCMVSRPETPSLLLPSMPSTKSPLGVASGSFVAAMNASSDAANSFEHPAPPFPPPRHSATVKVVVAEPATPSQIMVSKLSAYTPLVAATDSFRVAMNSSADAANSFDQCAPSFPPPRPSAIAVVKPETPSHIATSKLSAYTPVCKATGSFLAAMNASADAANSFEQPAPPFPPPRRSAGAAVQPNTSSDLPSSKLPACSPSPMGGATDSFRAAMNASNDAATSFEYPAPPFPRRVPAVQCDAGDVEGECDKTPSHLLDSMASSGSAVAEIAGSFLAALNAKNDAASSFDHPAPPFSPPRRATVVVAVQPQTPVRPLRPSPSAFSPLLKVSLSPLAATSCSFGSFNIDPMSPTYAASTPPAEIKRNSHPVLSPGYEASFVGLSSLAPIPYEDPGFVPATPARKWTHAPRRTPRPAALEHSYADVSSLEVMSYEARGCAFVTPPRQWTMRVPRTPRRPLAQRSMNVEDE